LKFPFPVRPLHKIGGLFLCLLSVYANKELYLLCFSHGHMIFSHLFSDLEKLGGLIPLIQELNNADEGIRTTSAWVLGKASQNNVLVQNQVLSSINLTGLQLFSLMISLLLLVLSLLKKLSYVFSMHHCTGYHYLHNSFYTWLDPWLWSFEKISEHGLFQFCSRSCKSLVCYILLD